MLQEAKKNTKYHAFLLIVSEIAEWSYLTKKILPHLTTFFFMFC